jgi:GT2 family glycosyltransferase
LRHLDRGSREPDLGQYEQPEYVFGATGAACLYRRAMMEDIALDGEFFDNDFFAYREDADVAWRAQLLGWKCLYTPPAVAYHVRSVLPSNRASLPAFINMHSVKNRWLLRIKNMTAGLYRRHWLSITWRDCLVIGGCLLREFSSLRAFVLLVRAWPRTWRKRRAIMRKRRASEDYIAAWFSFQPVSFPAPVTVNTTAGESVPRG